MSSSHSTSLPTELIKSIAYFISIPSAYSDTYNSKIHRASKDLGAFRLACKRLAWGFVQHTVCALHHGVRYCRARGMQSPRSIE